MSAKLSHLVDIFEEELECPIKLTKLTYASLYPTNFVKQKVSLAMNIFHEKTVTALGIENYNDIKVFVEAVTRLWHIVNVKTPHDGVLLNGKDREPIKIVTDERLIFLQQMANAFLEINTSSSQYKSRAKCLTVDTSEALHLTLIGFVDMVKMLLVNKKPA